MGKVVQGMSVSLDGFFEGPDGDIGWHRVDEELHQHFNDSLRTMSAFIDGRVCHEGMAEFWPTADADPDSAGPMAEFAGIWRDMPKIVYSRTLERADWNTTVLREIDPDHVRDLAARSTGDIAVGGATLCASFRALDLIDEYRTYVHPVLVGRGRRLFPDADAADQTGLDLVETRVFGNGVVLLRHVRR